MSDNRICNLPLEKVLFELSKEATLSVFPSTDNYFTKYCEVVGQLRREVYDRVNAGLAALSNQSGLYTDHGKEHYDQVVLYAGKLLGVRDDNVLDIARKISNNSWVLKPYELYLLLLSIRFHDVGNIYGRENHERNISTVIKSFSVCHLHTNPLEARKICEIAGAHGGRTITGSKDTIGFLSENTNSDGHLHDIGFKKLASITRLADEICENRNRNKRLDRKEIPIHNLVFHVYAHSIVSNFIRDKVLFIKLEIKHSCLIEKYKVYDKDKDGHDILVDVDMPSVICDRLKKAELERRYCNRFLSEEIQIKEINVAIDIVADEKDEHSFTPELLGQKVFTLKEVDYPTFDDLSIHSEVREFLDEQCKPLNVQISDGVKP